ncbi:hypothetical protein IWX90DRAFT_442375 [Phyllosticta citrichinensis]|uniref:Uncharacterized protein n=1 Tax=Phyllosticta citrichinensis TaxID=1130410 RepID=A0ABR1XJT9_9PEZI
MYFTILHALLAPMRLRTLPTHLSKSNSPANPAHVPKRTPNAEIAVWALCMYSWAHPWVCVHAGRAFYFVRHVQYRTYSTAASRPSGEYSTCMRADGLLERRARLMDRQTDRWLDWSRVEWNGVEWILDWTGRLSWMCSVRVGLIDRQDSARARSVRESKRMANYTRRVLMLRGASELGLSGGKMLYCPVLPASLRCTDY